MDRLEGWVLRHRVAIGVILLALGIGASVLLAFAASSTTPPDGAQSALLVIVGGLLNLGGAWAVSRRPGSPNLTGSRVAVRHLAKIATDVGRLKTLAEVAFESRPPGKNRDDIGQLSWRLSDVESRLTTNLEDWAAVYPALQDDPRDARAGELEKQ